MALPGGPGMTMSFDIGCGNGPWLWANAHAPLYEMFHVRRLALIWEPTCPATTVGAVMVGLESDVADPPAATDEELLAMTPSKVSVVYQPLRFDVPVSIVHKHHSWLYTCVGPYPALGSIHEYLPGRIEIRSTVPLTGLGRFMVDYVMELKTPQLPPATAVPRGPSAAVAAQPGVQVLDLPAACRQALNNGLTSGTAAVLRPLTAEFIRSVGAPALGLAVPPAAAEAAADVIVDVAMGAPAAAVLNRAYFSSIIPSLYRDDGVRSAGSATLISNPTKSEVENKPMATLKYRCTNVHEGDNLVLGFNPSVGYPNVNWVTAMAYAATQGLLAEGASTDPGISCLAVQSSPVDGTHWMAPDDDAPAVAGEMLFSQFHDDGFAILGSGTFDLTFTLTTDGDFAGATLDDLGLFSIVTATCTWIPGSFALYNDPDFSSGGALNTLTAKARLTQTEPHGATLDLTDLVTISALRSVSVLVTRTV